MEENVHDNSGSDNDTKAFAPPGRWQMPKPGFEVGDAVSMSVREGNIIGRRNFKVAASRESPEQKGSQRKWEYQLKDDHGDLHAKGAWFQQSRDKLSVQK